MPGKKKYTEDFGLIKGHVKLTNEYAKENLHQAYYMSQMETYMTMKNFLLMNLESLLMSIIVLVFSSVMARGNVFDNSGRDAGDYANLSFTVFTVILINVNFLILLNVSH